MSVATSASTPSPSAPDGARETDEERTDRHLAVLKELTEIGLKVARAVGAQATGEAPPDAPTIISTDLGLTLSRITRAVRQTVALEAKLVEDRRAVQAGHVAKAAQETKVRAWLRKAKVQDIVERAIETQETGDAAEDLLSDLAERLSDPDDEALFADRPLPELVARICRDLGVTPPPSLWDDADGGVETAEADAALSSTVGGPPPPKAVEGEAPLPGPSAIDLNRVSPPPPTEEESGAADETRSAQTVDST